MLMADNKSNVTPAGDSSPQTTPLDRDAVNQGDYFFIDAFADQGAGEIFMAVMPPAASTSTVRPPTGLPSYLAHLWSMPILNQQQEQHCFRKLNYLKYLMHSSQTSSKSCVACREMLDDIEALRESIVRTRNFIVESNLRLAVSIAKRQATISTESFDELLCIGNETLMRAVDLFDFRRGIRFSTYAYSAIHRSVYEAYRQQNRYRKIVVGDAESALDYCEGDASASDRAVLDATEAAEQAGDLLNELDDRDRHIVMARFGMDGSGSGVAFHVIAKEIRLSTTRTVQLFNRSIEKLRAAAERRKAFRKRVA
ncbi:MAG: sigma-70 family RNA polymerase sigma factor [Pirellulaceae bacterium]